MKKINIQQAIFLLSTWSEKERELSSNLHSYKVPISVNGKDVIDKKRAKQMLEEIEKLNSIQKDIYHLKTKLAKANIETKYKEKFLNEYLEEVRIKRTYLSNLNSLLKANYTKIENGIGVVQYGVLNEDFIKEKVAELEVEVYELSQNIDFINANTNIDIELLSEK